MKMFVKQTLRYPHNLISKFEEKLIIEVNPYKPFHTLRKFIHAKNLCYFISCNDYILRDFILKDFIKKEIKIR